MNIRPVWVLFAFGLFAIALSLALLALYVVRLPGRLLRALRRPTRRPAPLDSSAEME